MLASIKNLSLLSLLLAASTLVEARELTWLTARSTAINTDLAVQPSCSSKTALISHDCNVALLSTGTGIAGAVQVLRVNGKKTVGVSGTCTITVEAVEGGTTIALSKGRFEQTVNALSAKCGVAVPGTITTNGGSVGGNTKITITKTKAKRSDLGKRAFVAKAYSAFQISSGKGGTAQAQANAIFVDPFKGTDLKTVSAATIKSMQSMRVQAEAAESDFNTAIAKASGTAATALQVGKIKNKVLKLTAEVQVLLIQAAQGKSSSSLAVEQGKLANNVKLDVAAKGKASTAIANSAAAKNAA